MAFTEFYCQSTGNNLNSGSTNTDKPRLIYENGSWVASTGVFTVATGNPRTDGVEVGEFVSVYTNTATITNCVARVTAVTDTTITVSLSVMTASAPSDGSNNTTLRVGGAWGVPDKTQGFPVKFVSGVLRNINNNLTRLNMKNDVVYNVTASISTSTASSLICLYQGYQNTVGDQGKVIIDGGTVGASYVLFSANSSAICRDIIFQNNGATGNSNGVEGGSNRVFINRCVFRNFRGNGLKVNNGSASECEAYNNNLNDENEAAGFNIQANVSLVNCVAHHNNNGFICRNGTSCLILSSISYLNNGHGIVISSTQNAVNCVHCDVYGNQFNGIKIQPSGNQEQQINISNCNIGFHDGYAVCCISGASTFFNGVRLDNCGLWKNISGAYPTDLDTAMIDHGSITYDNNEIVWKNPNNGNFQLSNVNGQSKKNHFMHLGFLDSGVIGSVDLGAVSSLQNDELLNSTNHVTRTQSRLNRITL